MWITLAGILLMSVGIHDMFFAANVHKSMFVIVLGMVGGACFLLNALLQWRKYR